MSKNKNLGKRQDINSYTPCYKQCPLSDFRLPSFSTPKNYITFWFSPSLYHKYQKCHRIPARKRRAIFYLAYSTTLFSLMTITLISPGYFISSSILSAIPLANL